LSAVSGSNDRNAAAASPTRQGAEPDNDATPSPIEQVTREQSNGAEIDREIYLKEAALTSATFNYFDFDNNFRRELEAHKAEMAQSGDQEESLRGKFRRKIWIPGVKRLGCIMEEAKSSLRDAQRSAPAKGRQVICPPIRLTYPIVVSLNVESMISEMMTE
jgi:hypothetical protein